MFEQYRFYVGIVVGAVLLAWQFWPILQPRLVSFLQWFTRPIGGSSLAIENQWATLEVDADTQAFQAVKLLHDRFSDNGCAEGVKAAETALALLLRKGASRSA